MNSVINLSQVKSFLGDRAWSPELVLRVGAGLLRDLNGVSGGRVAVCQIIRNLLDDAEKADKERLEGSTGTVTSIIPWDECKRAVDLLPVVLDLLFPDAAAAAGAAVAGSSDAAKPAGFASRLSLALTSCFALFRAVYPSAQLTSVAAPAAPVVAAAPAPAPAPAAPPAAAAPAAAAPAHVSTLVYSDCSGYPIRELTREKTPPEEPAPLTASLLIP